MVDLYIDDMSLERILPKYGKQLLIFKNKEKDESLEIIVDEKELKNIYVQVKNRCETLNLIPIKNRGEAVK